MSIFNKFSSLCLILTLAYQGAEASAPFLQERELLITGCARSGTTFVARVLRKSGLDVGHEKDASYGIVSWSMGIDTRDRCWGPPSGRYHFKHIFHQVRHPLKTIASFHLANQRSWNYVYRHIPQVEMHEKMIVRCAKYWIYWNLRAEKRAEFTYRVEDIAAALPEMERRLGIKIDPQALQVSAKINQRAYHVPLTWEILYQTLKPELYSKLVRLAERYGYDVKEARSLISG